MCVYTYVYIYIHIHIFSYIHVHIWSLYGWPTKQSGPKRTRDEKQQTSQKRIRSENCLWSRCWRTRRLIRCVGLQPRVLGGSQIGIGIFSGGLLCGEKRGFWTRTTGWFPSASIFLMRGAYNSQAGFCEKSKKLSLGKKNELNMNNCRKKNYQTLKVNMIKYQPSKTNCLIETLLMVLKSS